MPPADALERLDDVESPLALEVRADKEKRERPAWRTVDRTWHRKSRCHDLELCRVGAPAEVDVARPVGENVDARGPLHREEPVVDPEDAVDPPRSPERPAEPGCVPPEVVAEVDRTG